MPHRIAGAADGDRSSQGYRAATRGGCIGGILGAGAALLLALPFWPRGEDEGWAELGWAIFTLIACSIVGITVGAVGVLRALRREHMPDAGLTAVVFVPTAGLLLFGGPLVLVAPAAARWITLGLRQWWQVGRARRRAPALRAPAAGRAQRVVLWVVLTGLGMSLSASMFNSSLGHQVGGAAKVWVFCAVVPMLLLPLIWRALPRLAVSGLLLAALVLGAAMARTITAELHPSPERFAQIARDLEPPAGQRIVSRTSALAVRYPGIGSGDGQPIEIIESSPAGQGRSGLPFELTPGPDGLFISRPEVLAARAPAAPTPPALTAAGLAAAAGWERALRALGWVSDPPGGGAGNPMDWLPRHVSEFLAQHGGPVMGRGLWQQAIVVPFGDGAIVVLSTRP